MLQAISTKLGHNNNDHLPFMSHDLEGSKGHAGVTEVKSVIFFKKFQLKEKKSNCDVVWAYQLSLDCAQNLSKRKIVKGH